MALPVLRTRAACTGAGEGQCGAEARTELLSAVKAGDLTIVGVLAPAETDETVKKTRVSAVVKALPGVGKVRAAQILEELAIADNRRPRRPGREPA